VPQVPQVPHLGEITGLFARHLENGRCRKVPQVPHLGGIAALSRFAGSALATLRAP